MSLRVGGEGGRYGTYYHTNQHTVHIERTFLKLFKISVTYALFIYAYN